MIRPLGRGLLSQGAFDSVCRPCNGLISETECGLQLGDVGENSASVLFLLCKCR